MRRYPVIFRNGIRNYHPANFAMVMATGIMSIAFETLDFHLIARILFALNLILYFILCIILATRLMISLSNFIKNSKSLRHAFVSLTFVVGTNTIGIQLIVFNHATELALILWFIALTCWFVCIYLIILGFISIQKWSILLETVNGTALLIVVSTVSISLLGIYLLDAKDVDLNYPYLVATGLWILGVILYLIIATILFYLLFFKKFELKNWNAPYWICMGAAAIITLTGSELVIRMPFMQEGGITQGIILWMTIFAWGIGTVWIPYLLLMDIRKFTHMDLVTSVPMWIKIFPWSRLAFGKQFHSYESSSWSRVFPMGMYMTSTLILSKTINLGLLAIIPPYWGWFALLIWLLTFIGMLRATVFTISRS